MTYSHRAGMLLTVAAVGCADLALEPNQVATSMVIAPTDTLITAGDEAKLTVTVLDQDGIPIAGPPSWAPPEWVTSDPAAIEIAADGSVTGLRGGALTVSALLAGLDAKTRLRVNPRSVVLSAPTIYLNQAIQNVHGSVPIIAGRDALLRVFVTGDQVSFYEPRVQADFYHDGEIVHSVPMHPASDLLPHEVQEGRLDRSFNAEIPGAVLQPGVEVVVELDPDGVVPTAPGSQLRIPADGTLHLDVLSMPRLDQTIVPILLSSSPDERVFSWTRGMTPEGRQVRLARTLLPIGEMTVTVHEPYYSSADLTTSDGWRGMLREIRTMRVLEGQEGYYYGAVQLPSGSSFGGLGYVAYPASVGRPRDDTYGHELGHNMSLRHAPCGGPSGPDPDFPYANGSSGVWGYDFEHHVLVDPEFFRDLMGYCRPDWISDYHFRKAMDFRLAAEMDSRSVSAADRGPPERMLLLWGSAGNGELLLEPAFMVDAPLTLPEADGPYLLEGFGPGGQRYFSFAFTPDPVEFGGGQFLFTVPHDPERHGALERVVLSGPEGSFTLEQSGASPMAIITSRASGQVRAIVRDWGGGFSLLEGDTEIMVSDGLPGGGR